MLSISSTTRGSSSESLPALSVIGLDNQLFRKCEIQVTTLPTNPFSPPNFKLLAAFQLKLSLQPVTVSKLLALLLHFLLGAVFFAVHLPHLLHSVPVSVHARCFFWGGGGCCSHFLHLNTVCRGSILFMSMRRMNHNFVGPNNSLSPVYHLQLSEFLSPNWT